jgi:23S rRNA pseudouridine2605 synthase
MMRINRYLATCGVASRRAAESIILAGRVTLNGAVVTDLATQIDESSDIVMIDGQPLQQVGRLVYVLLNKPKGYVTTASDDLGRRTVLELVTLPERIFPVGRLDMNSTGLLILTNDGELAFRLTHPNYKVAKIYHVTLESEFNPDHFTPLTQGIILEDGSTQPCMARFFTSSHLNVEIELREGRQQQVRRMFGALGYRVKTLNRVRFGPVKLEKIPRGRWRFLNAKEVNALRGAVGLN